MACVAHCGTITRQETSSSERAPAKATSRKERAKRLAGDAGHRKAVDQIDQPNGEKEWPL